MILHVLQELAVPGRMRFAGVGPEHLELGQQRACERAVDVGHAQDVPDIGRRLPVGRQSPRLAVEVHGRAVACPLALHVRYEARVPGACRLAAFGPVQNEFRYRILDEMATHTGAKQDLECIGPGFPVLADRLRTAFACGVARLLLPPASYHLRAELCVPRECGFSALGPVGHEVVELALDEHRRNPVQRELTQQLFVGPPACGDRCLAGCPGGSRGACTVRRRLRRRIERESQAGALLERW